MKTIAHDFAENNHGQWSLDLCLVTADMLQLPVSGGIEGGNQGLCLAQFVGDSEAVSK
ncbi:hypothetical protein IQ266_25985 [filamentous cyanobacterium LEGE 11480]|uniref:Uncharacterized protein n=1 Tax=Romeriopsis navalis LEGE 11480 TaxID=2777977 RepID=A0A928VV74_9CYAN|nr:hypothetical protein [Romeriopsis navalis]MBE9033190.1 hypothetical protein [Romeriopsis navalis LEGE 11480]